MKTIITFMLIFGISIGLSAQSSNSGFDFQKKDFKTFGNKDSIEYFSISPLFKSDTSILKLRPFHKLPYDNYNQNNPSPNPFMANNRTPELRMPVLGGSFYSKMPILVPDSSVQYYIKEKRILFVNPLEKKYK